MRILCTSVCLGVAVAFRGARPKHAPRVALRPQRPVGVQEQVLRPERPSSDSKDATDKAMEWMQQRPPRKRRNGYNRGRNSGGCFGRCGRAFDEKATCQCNAQCHIFQNCCYDYQHKCLKKPLPKYDKTYKVFSYNICWGCMEGDPADTTAMKKVLKDECTQYTDTPGVKDENGMGLNVTRCASNMGEAIAKYHGDVGGYDLMAFQEASNFGDLRLGKRGVQMEKVQFGAQLDFNHEKGIHMGKPKKAWVVSLYDKVRMGRHDVAISGVEKSDSGRPYLIIIFDAKELIFINLHNTQPGFWFNKRRSWKNFPEEMSEKLESAFAEKEKRKNYRVILAGDFNDLGGELPGSLVIPWTGGQLDLKDPLAKTCCTSSGASSQKMLRHGDFIFDTRYPAKNRIPFRHNMSQAQSDHLPVQAQLGSR